MEKQFLNPKGAFGSPAFSQVTAVGDMRQFQLGARWSF